MKFCCWTTSSEESTNQNLFIEEKSSSPKIKGQHILEWEYEIENNDLQMKIGTQLKNLEQRQVAVEEREEIQREMENDMEKDMEKREEKQRENEKDMEKREKKQREKEKDMEKREDIQRENEKDMEKREK